MMMKTKTIMKDQYNNMKLLLLLLMVIKEDSEAARPPAPNTASAGGPPTPPTRVGTSAPKPGASCSGRASRLFRPKPAIRKRKR